MKTEQINAYYKKLYEAEEGTLEDYIKLMHAILLEKTLDKESTEERFNQELLEKELNLEEIYATGRGYTRPHTMLGEGMGYTIPTSEPPSKEKREEIKQRIETALTTMKGEIELEDLPNKVEMLVRPGSYENPLNRGDSRFPRAINHLYGVYDISYITEIAGVIYISTTQLAVIETTENALRTLVTSEDHIIQLSKEVKLQAVRTLTPNTEGYYAVGTNLLIHDDQLETILVEKDYDTYYERYGLSDEVIKNYINFTEKVTGTRDRETRLNIRGKFSAIEKLHNKIFIMLYEDLDEREKEEYNYEKDIEELSNTAEKEDIELRFQRLVLSIQQLENQELTEEIINEIKEDYNEVVGNIMKDVTEVRKYKIDDPIFHDYYKATDTVERKHSGVLKKLRDEIVDREYGKDGLMSYRSQYIEHENAMYERRRMRQTYTTEEQEKTGKGGFEQLQTYRHLVYVDEELSEVTILSEVVVQEYREIFNYYKNVSTYEVDVPDIRTVLGFQNMQLDMKTGNIQLQHVLPNPYRAIYEDVEVTEESHKTYREKILTSMTRPPVYDFKEIRQRAIGHRGKPTRTK